MGGGILWRLVNERVRAPTYQSPDRPLQRLEARDIPKGLVKWIDAFCSDRSATIVVNGYTSERRELPQAGLPQGPRAVQDRCKWWLDRFFRRLLGLGDESDSRGKRVGIQDVIDKALEWERRSGTTFEEDKTVITHFTRHPERTDESPYTIKGQAIIPKTSGKILGLVMDSELRGYPGPSSGHVSAKIEDANPPNGETAVCGNGGTDYGLRLYLVASPTQGERDEIVERGTEDGCAGNHGSLQDGFDGSGGSGSVHYSSRRTSCAGGHAALRQHANTAERYKKSGNAIKMRWVSSTNESFTMGVKAKAEARKATDSGYGATKPPYQARSTRLRVLLAQRRQHMVLPESVGGYSKRLDKALPSKHTRTLYDALKRRESDILVQLRTGMARVNRYLHRIGAAETDICDCGQEEESVDHFLFRCRRWDEQNAKCRPGNDE
ncbi:reverse transcriptase [Fusarium oxysporum f. sp. phaseoli]